MFTSSHMESNHKDSSFNKSKGIVKQLWWRVKWRLSPNVMACASPFWTNRIVKQEAKACDVAVMYGERWGYVDVVKYAHSLSVDSLNRVYLEVLTRATTLLTTRMNSFQVYFETMKIQDFSFFSFFLIFPCCEKNLKNWEICRNCTGGVQEHSYCEHYYI